MSRKKIFILILILALILPATLVSAKKGATGGGGPPGGSGGGPPEGKGPGGGGHTETAGNNLSFPAFLIDGYSVTDVAVDEFTVIYTGDYPGLTAEEIAWVVANGPWYPQKTEGNLWQADYAYQTEAFNINWIDWGDAIEAVNPKLRRPYRLELVLYVDNLVPSMEAFKMAELEYPSSSSELQGTDTTKYVSTVASVASPKGKIVVQRTEGVDPATLVWNPTAGKWDGAEDPIPVAFQVENNVGGKLIFGASLKGWKPAELGAHRITFYLDGSIASLASAQIGNYDGNGSSFTPVIEGETNTPVVDAGNNLTYVDVTVTDGGGGGGGH